MSIINVNAYDSHKQNTDYNLVVSSNNASSCNLTYIQVSGNLTNYNLAMTKNLQDFNILIKGNNFTELKDTCLGILCTDSVSIETGSKCLTITSTGQIVSLSNIILVIVFLFLSALFFVLGYTFNQDKYILKSFFYLSALLMGLIAVNSGRIIASESLNLGTMADMGFIMIIPVISVFFLYVFIMWTIQTFKSMKKKEAIRWDY